MGIFSKLYQTLTGRGAAPSKHAVPKPAPRRQTAADAVAAEAQKKAAFDAEMAGGMASLKAKIAGGVAQIAAEQEQKLMRELGPEGLFAKGVGRLTHGMDFNSSNVQELWYVPEERSMYVTFQAKPATMTSKGHPQTTYRYWKIEPDEAREMYRVASKGIEIWDSYRVRGSAILHKKNYRKVG